MCFAFFAVGMVAEYRYNMYCTGNKDDLNTFLKRLGNVCKKDD